MLRYIKTCEHLELRPTREERERVKAYLWWLRQEETSLDEIMEYTRALYFGEYEPYCRLRKNPCVVVEPSVLTINIAEGGLYQPLGFTLASDYKIKDCKDRKLPGGCSSGLERIDEFLANHIKIKDD